MLRVLRLLVLQDLSATNLPMSRQQFAGQLHQNSRFVLFQKIGSIIFRFKGNLIGHFFVRAGGACISARRTLRTTRFKLRQANKPFWFKLESSSSAKTNLTTKSPEQAYWSFLGFSTPNPNSSIIWYSHRFFLQRRDRGTVSGTLLLLCLLFIRVHN